MSTGRCCLFAAASAAFLGASAMTIDAPASVVKTESGWSAVYAVAAPVKANHFALENAPAGAWTLTADSWRYGKGDALAANASANFPKVTYASRFQFDVAGDADPKFGRLSVTLEPLADDVDPKLMRVVQQRDNRVFADFGRDTAVRGVFLPKSATNSVTIVGGWDCAIEERGGDALKGRFSEKDGKTYFEFHDVQRHRYFAIDGAVRAADVSFDVVPYNYAKHLTNETWERKLERLKWWTDSRFGLFVHFGLYAVPARQEWVKSNERISEEKYREYFETFNPDRFDAKAWAKAAKEAGMKYAVLTTRHHEGFSLFDTKFSDYKITNTPFGRDLVKEFVEAFRAEGLKVGFYYSLLDWYHPDYTIDCLHPPQDQGQRRVCRGVRRLLEGERGSRHGEVPPVHEEPGDGTSYELRQDRHNLVRLLLPREERQEPLRLGFRGARPPCEEAAARDHNRQPA